MMELAGFGSGDVVMGKIFSPIPAIRRIFCVDAVFVYYYYIFV